MELNTISQLLTQFYDPRLWADAIMGVQNWVQLSTSVYANCDAQKLFNTVTALITTEGASTLGARLTGGFISDMPMNINTFLDSDKSEFDRFRALGNLFQTVFNYSI